MSNILILGASGYVGGELLRLLDAHPALRVAHAIGDSRVGEAVAAVHPHLALAYPGLMFETYDPALLNGVDLVFAALPHGHSQAVAPAIVARGVPFVDLGADFRLRDPAVYQHWYGHAHGAPELLGDFVYGIPEIVRDAVRGSRCVAAAGCYPTATILALKPLIDAGMIVRDTIIVDAVSGVTGAGRGPSEGTSFSAVHGSIGAYGLLDHRHTVEMQQALASNVLFTPHLGPFDRGILATCYGTATGPMDADAPLEVLRKAYASEPFIHVSDRVPATKWTLGSNAVHLTARHDARTNRVLAIAALDNLGKGAAGQMVQCANLMLGFDEVAGLTTCGVYP